MSAYALVVVFLLLVTRLAHGDALAPGRDRSAAFEWTIDCSHGDKASHLQNYSSGIEKTIAGDEIGRSSACVYFGKELPNIGFLLLDCCSVASS